MTADPDAPMLMYRIIVHARSNGHGGVDDIRAEVSSSSASLRAVANCIAGAVNRFEPWLAVPAGDEIVLPFHVVPPAF